MRIYARFAQRSLIGVVAAVLLLTSCGQAAAPTTGKTGQPLKGGTAIMAGYVGETPTYLFPLYSSSNWDVGYVPWFNYLMWRPLYLWGKGTQTVFNPARSIGNPPVFSTNAAGDTVATVTLKHWLWSDGQPVTTRDVQFWMNLVTAEKENWAPYVPGKFPDNVKSVQYLSATKFVVTFNATYSQRWLLGNELTQITPIPQHAWDKTSASSPIGNYDMTPAGARAVYNYLNGQAKITTAYATNPLWQVVSGAWQLTSYDPTTNYVAFKPNRDFSGPVKPHLSQLIMQPFTTDAAEFNALESGTLSYGYVPLNDLSAIPALKKKGYKIAYWQQDTWGGILISYAPKDRATPILKQLYVRAAMTHLLNMKGILKDFMHRLGSYASGPVPNPGGHDPITTAFERTDPYPYSVSAAKQLLRSHGWKVVPNGTTTCQHPGTGAGECGAGIAMGQPLTLTLLSNTQTPINAELTQYIKSNFSLAGITVNLHIVTTGGMMSLQGTCDQASKCSWDINLDLTFWPYGWPGWLQTGGAPFGCGSSGNYGDYCSATADKLINLTHTSTNPSAMANYQNYFAQQQPDIFLPIPVFRVSAIKSNLQGVTPQDPYLTIYPEDWYYTKG
ncbi:MAG TPA: ABC transporter substrate-binding protein [Candidatus Dormibacteraeota bacterium]|nr:ABC transporter substrate-binding protein [Candidatus Dormibacteraeota bacterium]